MMKRTDGRSALGLAALMALGLFAISSCGDDSTGGGVPDDVDSGVDAGDGDSGVDAGEPDLLFGRWVFDPSNPVISSGDVTSMIDYVAASDPHVILVNGTYYLYYTCVGCIDCDDEEDIRNRLCLATSTDGVEFTRHPDNPIIDVGQVGAWDSYGVETVFVMVENGEYKLYYMGADTGDAQAWLDGNAITLGSIGLATSVDGVHFVRHSSNPILTPTPGSGACRCGAWDSWAVEGPWVIKNGSEYWMYYGGAGSIDGVEEINGIGLASSVDGVSWTKHDSNPLFVGQVDQWDKYHVIDPCVVVRDNEYFLWYHGGDIANSDWYGDFDIGVAKSTNGIEWERSPNNPVLPHGSSGSWSSYGVMAPSVINDKGEWVMYFHGLDGFPEFTTWAIGRAVLQ